MNTEKTLPERIESVEQLEEMLSAPTEAAVEGMRAVEGDLMVLGVAGKMGPTLARMAKRASEMAGVKRRVIGVSRFSNPAEESSLNRHGIETIRADLLDRAALNRLPEVANILYMAGMKFGSTGNEAMTWAMNTYLPGMVCERFAGSRIVAFSTGNVYGLVPVASGGSVETDVLNPQGEYAMSCLGRERILTHFSRALSIPMAIIRLNYAVEMRYGVLVDLAQKVMAERPVDLSMGAFNAIWQADANAHTLAAFGRMSSPPFVLNVTGPEVLCVREVCERFGQLLGKAVRFEGEAARDALLNNAGLSHRLFGRPGVTAERMMGWIADWLVRDGPTLNKPTHFEARDGRF